MAAEFIDTLVKALKNLSTYTEEDVAKVRDKYPSGTKIYANPKDDYLSEGNYTVNFVDDAGQIHVIESGIALIPSVDEISYVCTTCGAVFDYPPAESRIDGKNVCRKCSASEALDAAGITEQTEILNIIR